MKLVRNGRTAPFPGFSRGVPIPIVGQKAAEPVGRYFYNVPVLVQRQGQQLQAEAYEYSFEVPFNGVHLAQVRRAIAEELKAEAPDQPAPAVVPLQPIFLGFIPQEELDRQEQQQADKTDKPADSPEGS